MRNASFLSFCPMNYVLCRPGPAHIDINTVTSSVSVPCEEVALGPSRFHSRSHVTVAELFFILCTHIRPIRRARHFASMSIKPKPSCLFGFLIVDIGSRNVAPFHMYHAIAVVNRRVHVVGAGNTWAVCHIVAKGMLVRNESVVRGLSSSRLCTLTGPVTFAQLLFIECSMVLAKGTPRIFISAWYDTFNLYVDALQPPTANAFDFRVFRRAPVAFS